MGYDRGDSFSFDLEPNGFYLVQNRKEYRHHDHIPFNLKGNIVFSVYMFKLYGIGICKAHISSQHMVLF